MEIIATASGIQFDTDMVSVLQDMGYAYIRILNSDFTTVARVFSDKDETSELTYCGAKITGFTKLDYIMAEDNAIKVRMSKNG